MDALEALGDGKRMDEILSGLMLSIETNPLQWPKSKKNPAFHVAFTDPGSCLNLVNVPTLAVYYKVEDFQVRLFYVEQVS